MHVLFNKMTNVIYIHIVFKIYIYIYLLFYMIISTFPIYAWRNIINKQSCNILCRNNMRKPIQISYFYWLLYRMLRAKELLFSRCMSSQPWFTTTQSINHANSLIYVQDLVYKKKYMAITKPCSYFTCVTTYVQILKRMLRCYCTSMYPNAAVSLLLNLPQIAI